jgi:Fe2+ or Zn2+ uptake regulation protein
MVCKKCGSVVDISLNDDIFKSSKTLVENENFDIEDLELNIYGVCSKCK